MLKKSNLVSILTNITTTIIISVVVFYCYYNFYITKQVEYIGTHNLYKIELKSTSENTLLKKAIDDNYQSFLMKYYENQSNTVNFWLTMLGILVGVSGVGIPLLLNASYKDKIQEMECRYGEKLNEMNMLINQAYEDYCDKLNQMNIIVENAKTKNLEIEQHYNERFIMQENTIKEYVEEAKKSEIKSKINALIAKCDYVRKQDKKNGIVYSKEEEEALKEAFDFTSDSLSLYPDDGEIKSRLIYVLGLRGIYYQFSKKPTEAIENFSTQLKLSDERYGEFSWLFPWRNLFDSYIEVEDYKLALDCIKIITEKMGSLLEEETDCVDIWIKALNINSSRENPQIKEILDILENFEASKKNPVDVL